MVKRVTHDFETRSAIDLRIVGAYKYSLHSSTRATCFAFKERGEGKELYFLDFHQINRPWRCLPPDIRKAWLYFIANNYEFSAHNSFFEQCIYDNILVARLGWPKIPHHLRRCTAAKAAACALPRALEGAGMAMNLRTQKDPRGYGAMMATCKPTKQYNAWVKLKADIEAGKRISEKRRATFTKVAPPMFLEPDRDEQKVFPVLYHYCKIDVLAEEELDCRLPDLIPIEQKIWELNQKLNWRGLRLDIPTTKKIVGIMKVESDKGHEELDELTLGLVTKAGAVKSILEYLDAEGVELPNLRAKTVQEAIDNKKTPKDLKRLLELRKSLSRTSTKKYQSFIDRHVDGRIQDILMYHGAGTGRDSGKGAQFHNLPRGLIKVDYTRPYQAIYDIKDCDADELKILYGENLSILFSSVLRNMIIPSKGCEMFVADFSAVEVAVCWWLADNKRGLKILTSGKDPYIFMAVANTLKRYEVIEEAFKRGESWAFDARQLGKAQVLGCGFGMGPPRFQQAAWDMYSIKLSIDQAKDAVYKYRNANAQVPALWKAYEAAAIAAIENPKMIYKAGKCQFSYRNKFLWVKLPSGRKLAYRAPYIGARETEYGEQKTIEFWGAKGKSWRVERTWGGTLTENIVQAVARDLMMQGALRLEASGYKALLTVHDEAINERKIGDGSLDEFIKILSEQPSWAAGLPIKAKGWVGERYRK